MIDYDEIRKGINGTQQLFKNGMKVGEKRPTFDGGFELVDNLGKVIAKFIKNSFGGYKKRY